MEPAGIGNSPHAAGGAGRIFRAVHAVGEPWRRRADDRALGLGDVARGGGDVPGQGRHDARPGLRPHAALGGRRARPGQSALRCQHAETNPRSRTAARCRHARGGHRILTRWLVSRSSIGGGWENHLAPARPRDRRNRAIGRSRGTPARGRAGPLAAAGAACGWQSVGNAGVAGRADAHDAAAGAGEAPARPILQRWRIGANPSGPGPAPAACPINHFLRRCGRRLARAGGTDAPLPLEPRT